MGINIEEVKRKKNEFIKSIDIIILVSDIKTEIAIEGMNELNRRAAKNMRELMALLS